MVALRELAFAAGEAGDVSALLCRPRGADILYVLAHGAGAPMTHPFMEEVAARLAERRVATFRYQFPYMEAGKKRPDGRRTLLATVRAACAEAHERARGLPVIAGGKSMGGRMTSLAMADEPIPGVAGLAFLGFPLHAAGRPGTERADHLGDVAVPMLFVQGTRDALADLSLIRKVLRRRAAATLHVVDGGDHSFKVLKRSGRTAGEVLDEVADAVRAWADDVV